MGLSGAGPQDIQRAQPANVAASDPTGLLCDVTLPAPSMTSSAGSTTIEGTWQANATAAGTAAPGGRPTAPALRRAGQHHPDLVLNNTSIASGQTVSVTSLSISAATCKG